FQYQCSLKVTYARVAMHIGWTNRAIMQSIVLAKRLQWASSWRTGRALRPADLLLFNWLKGKDACLDVTCISPFAGMGASSWAPGVALHNAVEKKKRKYASICEKNGYKFIPFAFSMFGEFDTELWAPFPRAQVAPKSFWRIFMETMMYRVLVYIIVIKHRHNVGHDTLVDICFRSGISAGQRQLISGLVTGVTNPYVQLICCSTRVTKGLIYVDLTGSSPLMQIGMTDFMPGRVVIDASQRKRVNATEDGFKGFCGSKTLEQEVWYLCDVLNYAFLASRLQYASLQTKLLRHSGVVASGPTFNDALCAFNTKMETGLLSNTSEIATPNS
ncbi:hypothetical protein Tco_1340065, partial [Tanacetum coccineum]